MSSRQFRNNFAIYGAPFDATNPSNFAKIAPGTYGPVTVCSDGSIAIASGAYADDVLAFVAGCIASNPTISSGIKEDLGDVIDDFDARAVDRHGYSFDEEEKNFPWKSVAAVHAHPESARKVPTKMAARSDADE